MSDARRLTSAAGDISRSSAGMRAARSSTWARRSRRPRASSASARSCSGKAMRGLFRRPFRLRLFLEQMEYIGVGSLPIIVLVGFFSAWCSRSRRSRRCACSTRSGSSARRSASRWRRSWRRCSPASMITARAGSGMATELGSMRITEQIDALSTLAVNPIQYLVTPRVIGDDLDGADHDDGVQHRRAARARTAVPIYFEHIDLGQFIEQFALLDRPEGLHHRRHQGGGVRRRRCRWPPATRASTSAAAPRRSGSPRRAPWSPARSRSWCSTTS